MDVDLSGTTVFASAVNGPQGFRFAVSVHEDKLQLWLEYRVSKQQWRTQDLQLSDYVAKDSAIPRAKPSDYAKRFVECLQAKEAEEAAVTAQGEEKPSLPYSRSLSDVSKDGSRCLVLSMRLAVASSFFVDLEYAFNLLPVALEKVDILDAQVRDLKDEIKTLTASQAAQELEITSLKLQLLAVQPFPVTRASTELRTIDAAKPNQALRWSLPACSAFAQKPFVLTDNEKCIEVVRAGTYLISLCVSHTSWNASTQVELVVGGKIVHAFTDGSPNGQPKQTFAPAVATTYTRDSTYVVTAMIPAKAKVQVNYRGNAVVNVGSTMSLVEL